MPISNNDHSHDRPTDRFPRINKSDSKRDKSKEDSPDAPTREMIEQANQLLKEGIVKFEEKLYPDAIKIFEKLHKLQPEDMETYEYLTKARSRQADIESVEEYLAIGKEYLHYNELDRALEELQTVLTIIPDHTEALQLVSQIQLKIPKPHSQTKTKQHAFGKSSLPEIADEPAGGPQDKREEFAGDFELSDLDGFSQDSGRSPETDNVVDSEDDAFEIGQSQGKPLVKTQETDIEKAIELYEAGKLDAAYQLLKQLDSEYPKHTQIMYYLDIIQRKLSSSKIGKNQENAEQLFKEGMDELDSENYAAAVKKFEEANRLKPDFTQAKLMLEKVQELKSPKTKPKTEPEKTTKKTSPAPKSKSVNIRASVKPAGRIIMVVAAVAFLTFLAYFFIAKYPQMQLINHLKTAKQKMAEKDYSVALKELKEAQRIDKDNLEAFELEGNILMELGQGENAAKAFERATQIDPSKMLNVLNLGQAYFQQSKYQLAEVQFAKAAAEKSFENEANYRLGLSLLKQEKKDLALETFKKVILSNPDYAPAHLEIAKLSENTDTPEIAENEYLLAIEKDSKLVDAYESLGKFYISLEKTDQAIEILNQPLLWLKPNNEDQSRIVARFRLLLGKAYFEKGDYEKSVDQYNKILIFKDREEEVYIELGRAYYRLNRDQQAILAWEHALEINPKNADVHFYLGSTYHRIGELKKELAAYQEAIKIDPKHARAYANIGFFYYNQYKYSLALDAWKMSLSIDANQPHLQKKIQEIANIESK